MNTKLLKQVINMTSLAYLVTYVPSIYLTPTAVPIAITSTTHIPRAIPTASPTTDTAGALVGGMFVAMGGMLVTVGRMLVAMGAVVVVAGDDASNILNPIVLYMLPPA